MSSENGTTASDELMLPTRGSLVGMAVSPIRPELAARVDGSYSWPTNAEALVPQREAMIRDNVLRFIFMVSFSLSRGLRTVRIIGSVVKHRTYDKRRTSGINHLFSPIPQTPSNYALHYPSFLFSLISRSTTDFCLPWELQALEWGQ